MIFRFSSSVSPSSGWEVFINWSLVRFFSSVSLIGWEIFHQQHHSLRLISFPTGLGCSQWSPGFPLQSPSLVGRFFHSVSISFWQFHAQWSLRLKKEAIVITWPWSGEFPKRKSYDNNHPELYHGQFDLHHNASFSRAPTWSHDSFSSYALVSPTHLSPHALVFMAKKDGEERWQGRITLDFLLSMQSEDIYGYENYLCFTHLSRNEVIISWASLDGVKSERSVGHNRVRSFLLQMSTSSLVLVRVYWLDSKGTSLVFHRYWSGLLAR